MTKDMTKWKPFWGIARILVGFLFLWTFLDKLFGFGLSTAPAKSWLAGVSPTSGFLAGTSGTFSGVFHAITHSPLVTWLFMLGLLFIGLTFIFGIGMRLGAIAGVTMLLFMWLALFPPSSNPFLDYHWFYAFALVATTLMNAGRYIGFGSWWENLGFVKKCPILR